MKKNEFDDRDELIHEKKIKEIKKKLRKINQT
jgi:hypothetical protein